MKERQLEISLHKDMMALKRKTLSEEKSQLQTALNQLQARQSQLQNRYEIITSVIGKDESGDFISPAMMKLKVRGKTCIQHNLKMFLHCQLLNTRLDCYFVAYFCPSVSHQKYHAICHRMRD